MDGYRATPLVELHKSMALKLRIIIIKLHTTDTLAGLLMGVTYSTTVNASN
jgi:hypothetical protein